LLSSDEEHNGISGFNVLKSLFENLPVDGNCCFIDFLNDITFFNTFRQQTVKPDQYVVTNNSWCSCINGVLFARCIR